MYKCKRKLYYMYLILCKPVFSLKIRVNGDAGADFLSNRLTSMPWILNDRLTLHHSQVYSNTIRTQHRLAASDMNRLSTQNSSQTSYPPYLNGKQMKSDRTGQQQQKMIYKPSVLDENCAGHVCFTRWCGSSNPPKNKKHVFAPVNTTSDFAPSSAITIKHTYSKCN